MKSNLAENFFRNWVFWSILSFAILIKANHLVFAEGLGGSKDIPPAMQEAAGEYEGEIRIQSSDGKIDRLIVPHAQLNIDVSGNELILTTTSDLIGSGCASKIGGVREMLLLPPHQPQVLRAVFQFDPNRCKSTSKWDEVVLFLIRDQGETLTAETVLSHGPVELDSNTPFVQKLNIHGFFVKKDPQQLSSS